MYVDSGRAGARDVKPPSPDAPNTGTVTFAMKMTQGTVNMTFDRAATPCAVNSFDSLVTQKFFDNTDCHRLVTSGIFVLQCGDPTATGTGGPGYTFADELSGKETYQRGTVAMANAGPNSNGSQFFIVWKDSPLPAGYDVLGKVSDASMAVIDAIAAAGIDPNDKAGIKPASGAHIETITAV